MGLVNEFSKIRLLSVPTVVQVVTERDASCNLEAPQSVSAHKLYWGH